MSERILETLMQLFALIAGPEQGDAGKRDVVEAFLNHLLNQELVRKYLASYDREYEEAIKKLEKSTPERREGAIAIRITKLCHDINEQRQLDQEQRVVVVIQALEFCKSGKKEISKLELEFIATLAEGLNITQTEYDVIREFVLSPISERPDLPNLLVINGKKSNAEGSEVKFAHRESFKGEIWILYLPSIDSYFMKFASSGEISMNGQLLTEDKVYPVSQGASIKGYNFAPVYYWDITMMFLKEDFRASKVVYEVNNLEYRFKSGDIGIHHMTFSGESGRMVGIMGASGAGKSTLLSVLSGVNRPSDGEVLLNGISIHGEPGKVKGLIGYVSQDDLLIEDLTVFDNLYFNAKLCFGNLTEEELVDKVDGVLKNLGLYEIRNMKVGSPLNKKISGGQRKRLNISLELIREPAVLFLDEPTSGLSSMDSENILDLLKELARKGKLLFIVIHQPSSDIFKMFDKLIILDFGGYLIYNGNPVDSIEYFKRKTGQANYSDSECVACGNVNPEQIFNIVEAKVFTESGKPTAIRRVSPEQWRRMYEADHGAGTGQKAISDLPDINFVPPGKFKQFVAFLQRDILSKVSDLQYLLVTLLEAPVLALFLSYLIRYFDESARDPGYSFIDNSNLPVYIFMSVIISLFMGLTLSAEEIIRDRKILKRETFLNLSWNSYLLSKVSVQFGISALQAFTFVLVGNTITGIKGMTFEYWLVLFSCWASANLLGLVISDSFKTAVTIYILIPFLIIPQIILSGVLVRFEKLNPNISSPVTIPFYGEMITARWGYEALAVEQFVNNRYEKIFYEYDREMSQSRFMKDYWYSKVRGKLDNIKIELRNPVKGEDFADDLVLVTNELRKTVEKVPAREAGFIEQLNPEQISPDAVEKAISFIESVRKYYIGRYNNANEMKDEIISGMVAGNREGFQKLKNDYFNTSLEETVVAKNEIQKTIEFNNEIIQKLDPIYMEPGTTLIKAHFYTPVKPVFGFRADTYWVNVLVIWFMTVILYLILYYRLLRKLLDSGGSMFGRRAGGSERYLEFSKE